jgi:hypothetical protein
MKETTNCNVISVVAGRGEEGKGGKGRAIKQ